MGKKRKKASVNQQKIARSQRMQNLVVFTILGVAVALGLFAVIQAAVGGDEVDTDQFDYENQPVLGDKNAPVKIVEFGDYKCPVCKRFEAQVFPRLKKDFIDQGKASMYFINNPFIGDDSVTAALAGEAVYRQNPEAFWKFYSTVYRNQGPEQQRWATPELLIQLAKKEVPGIDVKKLKEDLESQADLKAVDKDKEIARKLNVTSVPTVFINGKPVKDVFDYEALKKMIEEEAKKAR
ncbi:putative disulfide bond formation protein D [Marinithermofilum abyssi]|uniref:Putative disulfide bond formation protein D n=1 Tax=Marinithermofilum abyssi TaxID=1571185 RepID=A0A8J2VBL7_9BACL|nr:DsbA family protein [Marinithermofilum abyssi]GGE07491.1 putative disulfide bond formation protein D [Marinithermofilum abyssi]